MGIINTMSDFISGSHNQSRGIYILNELQATYNVLKSMDRNVANDILARYRHKRTYLLNDINSSYWDSEKGIKVAKQLQRDAKYIHVTDLSEAYSLWLTGAWIESLARDSEATSAALELLNELADYTDITNL